MHLLYLTFGDNISNHLQAHFSICSFLNMRTGISTINVITDAPAFYNSLEGFIQIIKADEIKLKKWKGEFDFFWRIKIKAIELICERYRNEPVIYLDSDTFLYGNICSFREVLTKGTALMYEDEGPLLKAKSKTEKRMWRQVENKAFGGLQITQSDSMWNAGVVATPNSKDGEECKLALAICDEMCKQGVTRRLIEQFALSVSLQKIYGLQAAKNTIAHYWSNKDEWNKAISEFFISVYFKRITPEQIPTGISNFAFDKIALTKKTRNTSNRLKNWVERIFPPREVSFIKKN